MHAEYVAEQARQMIFNQYGAEAYTRGLNVYLTLDSGRADARLSRPAQGHHGLRAAPGLSRPRGLHRPAGQPEGARRAHRRSAAGLPGQRRAASAAVVTEASSKKVVAVLQNGESVTVIGDGLKPATSALVAEGQSEDADPARRRRPPRSAAPRATGRSPSCPRSRARFVAMDPRTGASAPWSAASTTRRASSTTSPRRGASPARASSRSSTRPRWRRASRRRR